MGEHRMIAEHTASAAKVTAGGVGVGGGTFVAVDQLAHSFDIAQATAWAGLAAAAMTALYFGLMAILTAIKIFRAANGKD